jgi:hypothetical protein
MIREYTRGGYSKKNNYTSTPVAKTVLVVLPAPPTRGKRSIPFPEI